RRQGRAADGDRPDGLPDCRRARGGGGEAGASQRAKRGRADRRAAGASERERSASGASEGLAGVRAATGGAVWGAGAKRLWPRSERPAVQRRAARETGGGRDRRGKPEARDRKSTRLNSSH